MSAPTNDAATSAFPETAYADALVPGQPKEALALIQNRLRKAKAVTEELAEYFSARRELEDSYLKALSKLSKRPFLTDAGVLGPGFSMVYERLISELGETASVHSELEKKIGDECEAPFRMMVNKGEWGRVKEYDDSLSSTIKEISSLETQLSKDQKKAETASSKKASTLHSKAVETERSLQSSLEDWETEAPFAFEAYQRIDKNRLEAMKEIVMKFETAQADSAQRLMNITENSMQVTLGFEPEREMKTWLRSNRLEAVRGGGRSGRTNGSRSEREGTPGSMMSSNTTNGGTVRPTNGNGPGVVSEFGASRGHPANQSRSSLASGVQMDSLSTTNSRPGQAPSSSNPAPPLPTSYEKSEKSEKSGGSTLKNAFSRIGRGRVGKDKNDMNTVYGTLNEDAGPTNERTSTSTARVGDMGPPTSGRPGTATTMNEERSSGFGAAGAGAAAGAAAGGLMQPMMPTRGGSGSSVLAQSSAPQVDSEGYSIPPPDRKPWEAGGAGSSSIIDADGNNEVLDEGFTAPNPLRASSMNISSAPIQSGDQAGDKEALERVKSTLLTARSPGVGPTRRNTTRRDRRDVRATTYNPTLPSTDSNDGSRPMSQFGLPMVSRDPATMGSSSPSGAQSQFNSPQSTGFNGVPGLGDQRTQSIVSMSSMAANPFDMSSSTLGVGATGGAIFSSTGSGSSGLRGSITETVNAMFNGRDLAKILVVGELSLSLKDISPSQASSPLHLRIEAFEQLEKAAPNPQFLKPVEGAHGEYWLDTPALLALSAGQANGASAVVLKYQLHVSESSKESYLPLQVHSQWRCEPHQTSLLLTYTPTSNSKISEPTLSTLNSTDQPSEPTLTDLSFLTGIEPNSVKVSNVMSKPTGTWSAEKRKIMWRLNENVSLTNPVTQKVLARFQVESASVAQPTQIRWKVQGRTVSRIDVNLVGSQAGDLKFEEVRRNCVSGKFIANP